MKRLSWKLHVSCMWLSSGGDEASDNDSDQNGAVVDEDEAAEDGHGSSRVASGDVFSFLQYLSFI